MNIFEEKDYRQVIRGSLRERRRFDPQLSFQKLAASCRIPNSYLSRVLHGKADLSGDQLYLICEFFQYSEEEAEYLALLLEFARCGLKTRAAVLERRIKRIQALKLEAKEHLHAPVAPTADQAQLQAYYLEPLVQLVHVALMIPRYRKSLSQLASDLRTTPQRLDQAISVLVAMGLVRNTAEGWEVLIESLHLPRNSGLYKAWRTQVKLNAIAGLEAASESQSFSCTAVFATTEAVRDHLHRGFLSLLKEAESLTAQSASEHVYQMTLELFPWL